ncbi:oxidoreductase-like domain-containing protein [Dokdonella sp.]|uniref:oxidoreductase-like domain-containing protein n=1 Tax=Dokdonella sp. TaxID=2291710 RepID=UPI0031BFFC2B|nr:oxidoreductase-like protein [Dokdonella sp.]
MSKAGDDPRPEPPEKPDPGDCCGGGCVCCIYDSYENACEKYQAALAAWQARHPGVPAD